MIISNKNIVWDKCYLCDSPLLKNFYKEKDIVKCKNCSFVFYKPVPSQEDLDLVYSQYEREEYITENSVAKITKELKTILSTYNIKTILDIACGECYFLDILKSIDPTIELYATEHVSAKENVINKGYEFIEGEFFPITNKKFDLIIFTEAIEHINDANDFLANAYDLLNPNGLIYITTPNFSCLERLLMGKNWGMVVPPEHLSYFTPKTLKFVMKKNKFVKKFSKTENISIFRIIQFLNKFRKKNSSKISPQKISDNLQNASTSNIFLRFIKEIINVFLDFLNLGSSLKALYQKK
tara:strand:- start:248 stop:1135 length:888 start_codon:yes stop_codon:yes gene_type:complete